MKNINVYIYIYLFRERERQRMNQGFNWCCNYCEILGEMWLKNGPMWLVIKLMEKQLIKLLKQQVAKRDTGKGRS